MPGSMHRLKTERRRKRWETDMGIPARKQKALQTPANLPCATHGLRDTSGPGVPKRNGAQTLCKCAFGLDSGAANRLTLAASEAGQPGAQSLRAFALRVWQNC